MNVPVLAIKFVLFFFIFATCSDPDAVNQNFERPYPENLSQWRIFDIQSEGANNITDLLQLNDAVISYELKNEHYADHARSLRTLYLPEGKAARYVENDVFEFPVGTVISKTLFYGNNEADGEITDFNLIETRLLFRSDERWNALTYVWNEEQSDAVRSVAGANRNVQLADGSEIEYRVPDQNQCQACHSRSDQSGAVPLGLQAIHLNQELSDGNGENQIQYLMSSGRLDMLPEDLASLPQVPTWDIPETGSVNDRARIYLDINCAHCHRQVGPGNSSGMYLRYFTESMRRVGVCKSPTAAGWATGDRPYDIYPGRPDLSILVYRMESTTPGQMMPEIGRSTVHSEAVDLMKQWISSMEGDCE